MSSYKEQTYGSRSRIKRRLHQKRFQDALKILNLEKNEMFLDYGCGDGELLAQANKKIPASQLFGYEPAQNMFEEALNNLKDKNIKLVNNLCDLKQKFEKVSCFETLEHLTDEKISEALQNISQLVSDKGQIILSVPIEIGLSALFKNTFRYFFHKKYDHLNFKNYLGSFLGLSIARGKEKKLSNVNYIYSHIGFDYRDLEKIIKQYFKIEKKIYSPVNFWGPVMNNTIYYICV